jgi:hypothetical protein
MSQLADTGHRDRRGSVELRCVAVDNPLKLLARRSRLSQRGGYSFVIRHFETGVSRKLDEGAGAHPKAACPLPLDSCVTPPITRI